MLQITNEIQTMSSREIAELTGKQVSHVHRDFKVMADDLGFPAEGVLMPSPNLDLGFIYDYDHQKRISCIHLNRELTLTLVSGYSAKLRHAIIKRWQELEQKESKFQIPQTMGEALQLAADQAKQLELQAPMIEVYDKLANRKNDVSTTTLAKQLGVSAIKLNRWLKAKGFKCLFKDYPAANYAEWFNVVSDVSVTGHEFTQCLITPKGQIEIAKRWEKCN